MFSNAKEEFGVKKVAIYARVSTTEQAEEGYSIDEQLRLLKEWCKDKGHEVFQEYIDRGISGKSIKKREALQQLLRDASQKEFDIVIVWKTNRLARNILDTLKIIELLDKNNIVFQSYSENHENETKEGRFRLYMMSALAEYERENIAENVKMGMLARAREGSWNGGQVLGYDTVHTNVENRKRRMSKLVINEKEAQTVRRIFQLYTEGNGYKSIANRVNKEGHLSKKGNYFTINAIKTIVTNPVYAGYIRYNVRRDWNEKRRNNINPDPIIEKGKHNPIVSRETWEQAQAILKTRTGKPNRVHSGNYPLTGILKCPTCGASTVLSRTNNKNKDGTKRVLEYYVCGAWKNKGTIACKSNGVRVDKANQFVFSKLNALATSNELLHDVLKRVNQNNNDQAEPMQKEFEHLKKSISSLQAKKDKVLGLYEDGIIDKSDLQERLAKLSQENERLENRLKPIREKLENSSVSEISYKFVKEVLTKFQQVFQEHTNNEQQKRLVHLLIDEITVDDRRNVETIRLKFNQDIIKYLSNKGEDESLDTDSSSPFCVYLDVYAKEVEPIRG